MSLESTLKEQFVVEDAVSDTGTPQARLAGPFGNVGVEVNFPGGAQPWQLEPVAKISNPAHPAALDKMLDGVGADQADPHAGPRCEVHQPGAVGAALYHSVYLVTVPHRPTCVGVADRIRLGASSWFLRSSRRRADRPQFCKFKVGAEVLLIRLVPIPPRYLMYFQIPINSLADGRKEVLGPERVEKAVTLEHILHRPLHFCETDIHARVM